MYASSFFFKPAGQQKVAGFETDRQEDVRFGPDLLDQIQYVGRGGRLRD